jgi:predicted outer membrane repeat protein
MWFSSWLRNRTSKRAARRDRFQIRPAAPRFRPRLEALEDRTVPSQIDLTVSSLADTGPGTLWAAITTADSGAASTKYTIDFSVAGMITLERALPDLSNNIAIQGPGAASLTVQRDPALSALFSVFTVDSVATASISGLTIANGDAIFGGGITNSGTLTVSKSRLSGNTTYFGGGGGIANIGTLTVNGSTFSGNSATFGGALWNNGTVTIRNSTFTGNTAAYGGIYNGGTMTVSASTLSGNTSSGIFNPGGLLTVRDSIFTDNTAPSGAGGGIENVALGSVAVSGSTFSGNSAIDGGAIYNEAATLTVSGSTFSGNSASYGGAINNGGGRILTVKDTSFTVNTATNYGGGIVNEGMLTVSGGTFSGNSASFGGAVNNGFGATLVVNDTSFTSNNATNDGGGIDNFGTLTVNVCTLQNNSASYGGGIANESAGTLTVTDSTVCSNSAAYGADLFNAGTTTISGGDVCVIYNIGTLIQR